jgi:SAM-dependent methyltransferase
VSDLVRDAVQDGRTTANAVSLRVPRPFVTVACEFCGSSEGEFVTGPLTEDELADSLPPAFRSLTFRFVKCTKCGLTYLPKRVAVEDIDIYYPDDYKCFESYDQRGFIMKKLAQAVARRKLRQIETLMPSASNALLDYGCGSGTWLALLKNIGCRFHMIGTDVVPSPLKELRSRGMEAYQCDETTLLEHVRPGTVGIVHMFHVIEHLPDVGRVLRVIREVLAPGGVLIGQTPNVASFGRRFWGDLWNQWHAPQHLVLFSDQTLRRHAESAGFETLNISSSISGATQWANSALRWWTHGRRPFRGPREPMYPPLILAAIPLAVVESWFSHTCHMDFVFRKPL